MAGEPEEISLVQVRQPEVHLAARAVLGCACALGYLLGGKDRKCRRGDSPEQQEQQYSRGTGADHRQRSPGLHRHGVG